MCVSFHTVLYYTTLSFVLQEVFAKYFKFFTKNFALGVLFGIYHLMSKNLAFYYNL